MQLRPYLDDLRCKLPLFPVYCPGVKVPTHKDADGDGMHKSGSCSILLPYSQITTKEFSYCAKCNTTFFYTPVDGDGNNFLYSIHTWEQINELLTLLVLLVCNNLELDQAVGKRCK